MDAIRTVTISPSNRIFTNQSYIVGANKIIISDTPLPVIENPIIIGLKVQPNPTEGPFTAAFTLIKNTYVTVDVYNAMGQKVANVFNGNLNAGFQQIQGNLGGLTDGIYYLRLVTNSADTIVRKITKTEVY
ncbi:MAG: T9SS type A sorting domain-containing protein [Sphingobacteriales bacterium JAD_PAG50586_3]|nr:MAG: T9SS type A sorting domain-containing protein [Sphingobacteriales bacterium JAD_PAG50586_3]